MRISPITTSYNNFYKNNNTQRIAFKAHPDFDELSQKYDVTASSFFRRGPLYGIASDDYADIITVFKDIFKKGTKQKMLIAGVGESQEPFSYLATIKSLCPDRKLTDILDLKTVDLQSKPSSQQLFSDSYFEYRYQPDYAQSSFVVDVRPSIKYPAIYSYYRVNDEIFKFLDDTYKNNSLWDTRVQEAVKTFPDEEYDVISINNTLCYITDKDTRIDTVKNIYRTLKKGGTFITDPHYGFIEEANLSDSFIKCAKGIYKKK